MALKHNYMRVEKEKNAKTKKKLYGVYNSQTSAFYVVESCLTWFYTFFHKEVLVIFFPRSLMPEECVWRLKGRRKYISQILLSNKAFTTVFS